MAEGALEEALSFARRASLISRTEGLVIHEYLANLVLARARRYSGQASQSLRITHALEQVVPDPWKHWVEWERAFAGDPPGPEQIRKGTGARVVLRELREAAGAGQRHRFDQRAAEAGLLTA